MEEIYLKFFLDVALILIGALVRITINGSAER